MKFSHFFIDRPIFAWVISIITVIVGGLAYFNLPVALYPEIAPPTIVVSTSYPGAGPQVISDTVATPLEQEINGVENMLYMSSQCTSDGAMSLTITFKLGTDLDEAQVLVQNRVALAEPRLPEEVRRIGVSTTKSSPDLLMVVHLQSPDDTYDQLYISNYAFLKVRDVLRRIDGVGQLQVFGGSEYNMRVWLNPDRLSSLGMTPGDVVAALQEQNVQVAAGKIAQQPLESEAAFQYTITTLGRLENADQFNDIVVKTGDDGRIVKLKDVARVELGALEYSNKSYLNGKPAVAILVFQRPGSNALETSEEVIGTMDELTENFPAGLEYDVVYNPTVVVEESIDAVIHTIFEAVGLVIIVVLVFLQGWRATLIPLLAIPVSLIGTFAVMSGLGYSLNNLSLFGLVLAIGIVVDDAIVVVENIERNIEEGLSPRDAARKAMTEVGGAVIATSLVLVAVFVPTAFISGISGQFYQQFAITVAVSTVISSIVSLTLSPAMGAVMLKGEHAKRDWFEKFLNVAFGWFFRIFNKGFDSTTSGYHRFVKFLVRRSIVALTVFALLIGLTGVMFKAVPGGFIPAQDQGYAIVAVQLPEASSLERTDAVVKEATRLLQEIPGVSGVVSFAGFNGATRASATNAGALFPVFDSFDERAAHGPTAPELYSAIREKLAGIQEAFIVVVEPPPVRGLGTGGGFKMWVQDNNSAGPQALEQATWALANAANEQLGLVGVYTPFASATPQYFAEVNRTKAKMLDVPLENVFNTMQYYLGSVFVNEFNLFGRTYRVTAQADSQFRDDPSDVANLKTRNRSGGIVPLGSLIDMKEVVGSDRVTRYNLYPAAELSGSTLPSMSSGEALSTMEGLAEEILPAGFSFEWTDIAYQQRAAGNTAVYIFPLCVLFVFLMLAAQYESWGLPFAVILIVPMCLLSAIVGVWLRGSDNNILVQIGFVVLVGLACKNAILIVEFAKQLEDQGMSRFEAATEAARLRLRPILMTSFAFILGVVPMMIAKGAGAEMRNALGTTVFSGMLGVTFFGLLLTPVFYALIRKFARDKKKEAEAGE
ncbi:MAG: hydrophobe/amphiphile efflux-1 family RND transporter [Verrucomicrobiales bacterium]|nr:hydrophobe/amphiphile efflux-1 family RND transporter [Verrucomicrobiales bacterium]